jgi:glyoxylase-like metal-dependent hydrolase (beta-lactamase superfamily II)
MLNHESSGRRLVRGAAIGGALLLLTAWQTGSAQELADVQLKATQLSSAVYLLEPDPPVAGNLAVFVGEDGIVLVDDQMMPLTPKIRAAIAKIQAGEVEFLINSHYHYDHAGGNEAFGNEAKIVAHRNVRKRLAEGREAGARFIEGERPEAALPVITFDESVSFHWNGEQVDVVHLPNPSHTDGDSVIFFRGSNVIHTGDQFVNVGGYPYIDRDVGGSALGLRDNMAALLEMIDDETRIIPGHGPLSSKADLKWFHDLVSDTIAHIADEKNAGKSLEAIQADGLPAEFEKAGTSGFIPEAAWIQFVYSSLEEA